MAPGQMAPSMGMGGTAGTLAPGQSPAATVGGALVRPRGFGGLFSGLLGKGGRARAEEFKPTPAPERLADVLEPQGRRLSRGLFVGVITGSLALGALAALAWRMMGK